MARGTPDRSVNEVVRGTPDKSVGPQEILTEADHDGLTHPHADTTGQTEDDHHASLVHPFRRTEVGVSTTVSDENRIIGCTAHSITVTLASAAVGEGHWLVVSDESGGAGGVGQAITIDTEGGETIDGAASVTIDENHGAIWVYSDGANWFTLAAAGNVL